MLHAHSDAIATSRLARCGCGTYHLTLGHATLHLHDDELVLLARTILKMADRHPILQAKLAAGLCADKLANDDEGPPTGSLQ